MSQPFFGTTHFPLDVPDVKTTNILEFDPLKQIPAASILAHVVPWHASFAPIFR
jgi:hypothetical protein